MRQSIPVHGRVGLVLNQRDMNAYASVVPSSASEVNHVERSL